MKSIHIFIWISNCFEYLYTGMDYTLDDMALKYVGLDAI